MNDIVASPFAGQNSRAMTETAGARQSQHRELAEMQAKYLMAQNFRRDPVACADRILNAFARPSLAEAAEYTFSRGGQEINGPSIRAAEAIATEWENIEFGFREVSRGVGHDGVTFSEVEAFAVDLEKRTRRPLTFIVRHWRDRKGGKGYQITDERDIYELVANQAQRRVRACILALIPGDVVEAAMQQAATTLKAKVDVTPELVAQIAERFASFGVTREMLEAKLQRRLDAMLPAQVLQLKKIANSLRDGVAKVADFFDVPEPTASGVDAVKEAAAAKRKKDDPPPADRQPGQD